MRKAGRGRPIGARGMIAAGTPAGARTGKWTTAVRGSMVRMAVAVAG
ncbi:MAG TPA: hypothetical protein VF897_09595 [Roseiflexaceae bacterium]